MKRFILTYGFESFSSCLVVHVGCGPVMKWHIMAGVHGREKPLTSWPGSKREKEGRDWGPAIPFEGTPCGLKTSH
jgi:hypothetical protein